MNCCRSGEAVAVLALVGVLWFAGCGRDDTSPSGRGSPIAPSSPPAGNPLPPSTRVIQVGETVTGTITGNERECSFTTVDGGWGGLCHSLEITVPANGSLTATMRPAFQLFFKTSTGGQIDMACCGPPAGPLSIRVPVEAGVTYRIEVVFSGNRAAQPPRYPIEYTLDTAFLTTADTQPPGAVRALIFADNKTQRMAAAHLEAADGPKAGAVANFDPSSGVYEIPNLPSGFVQVRASAEGFTALTTRVPVGLSVVNEFVLQRRVPLPDATNSLSGSICAYPSKPGDRPSPCYTGVKVEILDGPLAGIFTFSDEGLAWYYFGSLPPGLIHVRAAADWVEPQILDIVVAGDTKLDFALKRR